MADLPATFRIRVENPGLHHEAVDPDPHVVLTIFTPASTTSWAHSGRLVVAREWFDSSPLSELIPGESMDVELQVLCEPA